MASACVLSLTLDPDRSWNMNVAFFRHLRFCNLDLFLDGAKCCRQIAYLTLTNMRVWNRGMVNVSPIHPVIIDVLLFCSHKMSGLLGHTHTHTCTFIRTRQWRRQDVCVAAYLCLKIDEVKPNRFFS